MKFEKSKNKKFKLNNAIEKKNLQIRKWQKKIRIDIQIYPNKKTALKF